jgi:hypothetical protein
MSAIELTTGVGSTKVRQTRDDKGSSWLFVDELVLKTAVGFMGDCGDRAEGSRPRDHASATELAAVQPHPMHDHRERARHSSPLRNRRRLSKLRHEKKSPGSPAMYSSHRIDSVTCLRRSSRCTAAQSGSACRRIPRRVPGSAPALANSRASSSVSMMSSDNGQLSPAASNGRIVTPRVAHRKTLRRHPGPFRKAERRDRIGARRGLVTPGDINHPGMVGEIISEWRARFIPE